MSSNYFSMSPHRNNLRPTAVCGADAVCVAGHWPGLRRLLLPTGSAGGPGTDLVSDAKRSACGDLQPLENQPQ